MDPCGGSDWAWKPLSPCPRKSRPSPCGTRQERQLEIALIPEATAKLRKAPHHSRAAWDDWREAIRRAKRRLLKDAARFIDNQGFPEPPVGSMGDTGDAILIGNWLVRVGSQQPSCTRIGDALDGLIGQANALSPVWTACFLEIRTLTSALRPILELSLDRIAWAESRNNPLLADPTIHRGPKAAVRCRGRKVVVAMSADRPVATPTCWH